MHDLLDGSLVISDPLARKLLIQLQRPAATRSRLDPIAIMLGYPATRVSGCMPQPPHSLAEKVIDRLSLRHNLYDEEPVTHFDVTRVILDHHSPTFKKTIFTHRLQHFVQ
jgi:hypothetical protein